MANQYRAWTEQDQQTLRKEYPATPTAEIAKRLKRSLPAVFLRARQLKLRKTPEFVRQVRVDQAVRMGNRNRGKPGHPAWNKGMKGLQLGKPFRPGHRGPSTRPVGSEAFSDGYLWRKIAEPNVWRQSHIVVWEALYGPVPEKHVIAFRDGNTRNCAPENLEAITRKEVMRRNALFNRYPPEISALIVQQAVLKRTIRKRERHGKRRRTQGSQ